MYLFFFSLVMGRGQERVKDGFGEGHEVAKSEYSENQKLVPNNSYMTD